MAGAHRRRHTEYYSKRRRRRRHHPYKQSDQLAEYQLQPHEAKERHYSSGSSMDEMDDTVYIPEPLPLLDIDITSWLPFPELSGAWRWCSVRVAQSLDWVKDAVFPSRVYQRELRETKDQLVLLHQQIEELKAQTLKIESVQSTPACMCSCQTAEHQTPQPGGPIPPQPSKPTAPPPPPPPPPPPISLPMKALVFKKKAATENSSQANGSRQQPAVTLSDIMNVRLKKVTYLQAKQPSLDVCNRPAVMTLTDVMNIQLRKTCRDKKSTASGRCEDGKDKLKKRRSLKWVNDENANTMILRSRISQEALQFRGSLKRVGMVRSPGGTPLKGKLSESQGTGLTPLMTKALHRKFKTIRTPSPNAQLESISPSFSPSN